MARKLGLTRARVTQVLYLFMLEPHLQDPVLALEAVDGAEPMASVPSGRWRTPGRRRRDERIREARLIENAGPYSPWCNLTAGGNVCQPLPRWILVQMPDEILTLPEVAKLLKVAEKTVYTMAQKNEFPAFKVRGPWRFKLDDIDAWIEQQKVALRPEGGRDDG